MHCSWSPSKAKLFPSSFSCGSFHPMVDIGEGEQSSSPMLCDSPCVEFSRATIFIIMNMRPSTVVLPWAPQHKAWVPLELSYRLQQVIFPPLFVEISILWCLEDAGCFLPSISQIIPLYCSGSACDPIRFSSPWCCTKKYSYKLLSEPEKTNELDHQ